MKISIFTIISYSGIGFLLPGLTFAEELFLTDSCYFMGLFCTSPTNSSFWCYCRTLQALFVPSFPLTHPMLFCRLHSIAECSDEGARCTLPFFLVTVVEDEGSWAEPCPCALPQLARGTWPDLCRRFLLVSAWGRLGVFPLQNETKCTKKLYEYH